MKNTFTHWNIIALLLVVLIVFTSVYMTGCSNIEQESVTTPATTSVATLDETVTNTEGTIPTESQQSTTNAESSTVLTEPTKSDTQKSDGTVSEKPNNNETSDKPENTVVSEGNTSLQHTHSYGSSTKKATCTDDGYTVYSCACGAEYTSDYVDALGHKWNGWVTVKEATSESEGKKENTCNRCGKVKSEAIDKIASPYDASCRSDEDLLAERILYYINQYRSTSASQLPRMKEFAEMRAEQLANDFSHNEYDRRYAAELLQYGKYIDPSSWGEVGREPYWQGPSEAIGKSTNCGGTIDEVAKRVAEMFYNSSGHWRYVGSNDSIYLSIGICFDGPTLYTCVAVGGTDAINFE